ncbi:hypothetical protein GE09DRAFT_333986 [Coniochaeta sp. 2T2.1]|nr:hypothetical protein GE09DRAFT_333986 [Coniochaeta sp. 2T2.1]
MPITAYCEYPERRPRASQGSDERQASDPRVLTCPDGTAQAAKQLATPNYGATELQGAPRKSQLPALVEVVFTSRSFASLYLFYRLTLINCHSCITETKLHDLVLACPTIRDGTATEAADIRSSSSVHVVLADGSQGPASSNCSRCGSVVASDKVAESTTLPSMEGLTPKPSSMRPRGCGWMFVPAAALVHENELHVLHLYHHLQHQ